jgi:hypothetical protein
MTVPQASQWLEEKMIAFYPLGDFKVTQAVSEIRI